MEKAILHEKIIPAGSKRDYRKRLSRIRKRKKKSKPSNYGRFWPKKNTNYGRCTKRKGKRSIQKIKIKRERKRSNSAPDVFLETCRDSVSLSHAGTRLSSYRTANDWFFPFRFKKSPRKNPKVDPTAEEASTKSEREERGGLIPLLFPSDSLQESQTCAERDKLSVPHHSTTPQKRKSKIKN